MRAHPIIVAASALCLTSPFTVPSLGAESPEHVVLNYLAAWNMHDSQRAAGQLAYDVTYFEPSAGQTLTGRDVTRAAVAANFVNAVPDAVWMLSGDHLIDGDKIAFEWEFSGMNTGTWRDGSAPTGKHVVLRGMSVFRVEDGKIVYQADYFDPEAALKAFRMM